MKMNYFCSYEKHNHRPNKSGVLLRASAKCFGALREVLRSGTQLKQSVLILMRACVH